MLRTLFVHKLVNYVWKKIENKLGISDVVYTLHRLSKKFDKLETRVESLEKKEDKKKSRLLS